MADRVEESLWEERQGWIRRQRESGLSVAHFCRDNVLHEGNFYSWRRRFARAGGASVVADRAPSGGRALQALANRGTARPTDLLPDTWKARHPEAVRTYLEVERGDKAELARLRGAVRRLAT